jgi:hypothetical protein
MIVEGSTHGEVSRLLCFADLLIIASMMLISAIKLSTRRMYSDQAVSRAAKKAFDMITVRVTVTGCLFFSDIVEQNATFAKVN